MRRHSAVREGEAPGCTGVGGWEMPRVGGGGVQGSLEPFTSPECNCRVSAVFRGRVRGGGNRIEGTFRTTDPNGYSRDGEWRVRRR